MIYKILNSIYSFSTNLNSQNMKIAKYNTRMDAIQKIVVIIDAKLLR